MSSILQSYEIIEPLPKTQSFAHYKGKADMSAEITQPDRLLRLSFIELETSLVNSELEEILLAMINQERSFVPVESVSDIPISLSITKNPKSPISYEATYLYPVHDPSDYVLDDVQLKEEVFTYDSYGILSWSLQASLEYAPFSGNGIFNGYAIREIQISISATTDFKITDFNQVAGIVTQGLNIAPNVHTLQYSERLTEDTSLKNVYQYTWQFGVV